MKNDPQVMAQLQTREACDVLPQGMRVLRLLLARIEEAGNAGPPAAEDAERCASYAGMAQWVAEKVEGDLHQLYSRAAAAGWLPE